MVNPGPTPHVGGPVVKGSPNVLTGKLPQARVGDQAVCVGPMDVIVKGSSGVFVNKLPAARIGDMTAHGGTIVAGLPTVIIGEIKGGGGGGAAGLPAGVVAMAYTEVIQQMQVLIDAHRSAAPFCEACFKKAMAASPVSPAASTPPSPAKPAPQSASSAKVAPAAPMPSLAGSTAMAHSTPATSPAAPPAPARSRYEQPAVQQNIDWTVSEIKKSAGELHIIYGAGAALGPAGADNADKIIQIVDGVSTIERLRNEGDMAAVRDASYFLLSTIIEHKFARNVPGAGQIANILMHTGNLVGSHATREYLKMIEGAGDAIGGLLFEAFPDFFTPKR